MSIKALLENSVLSEETKQVVQEAFEVAMTAKEAELTEQYKNKYEADLLEATVEIRNAVQESLQEVVAEEMQEIAEELKHARTLEVQYAEKLATFKESYAQKLEEQMQITVAEAVAEELAELKEDIEAAKKHEFVMQMFESFKDTYERLFGQADTSIYDELAESKQELDTFKRKAILADLLESVQGEKRKIAETILESTATDKLEAKFESIKGFLIAESTKVEGEQLTESAKGEEVKGRIVMENDEVVAEEKASEKVADPVMERLQRSLKLAR